MHRQKNPSLDFILQCFENNIGIILLLVSLLFLGFFYIGEVSGDRTAGNMLFKYSVFSYYLAVIFFLFLGAAIRNFTRYGGSIVFLSAFIYIYSCLPYGFDMTDEGFLASKSWFLFHGQMTQNVDAIFGTSFLSGLWLSFGRQYLLIWSRIGYAAVLSGTAFLAYNILRHYIPAPQAFFFLVPAFLLSSFKFPYAMNYNNLPVLFVLLTCYFHTLYHFSSKKNLFLFLSGVSLALSIFIRITNLIFIPVFGIFYFFEIQDNQVTECRKKAVKIYAGFLVALLVISGILYLLDLGHVFYDQAIRKNVVALFTSNNEILKHTGHDLSALVFKIKKQLCSSGYGLFVYLLCFPALAFVSGIHKISGVLMTIVLIPVVYLSMDEFGYVNSIIGINLSLGVLMLFYTRTIFRQRVYLYIWSLAVLVSPFIGSGLGMSNMVYYGGIFMTLPLTLGFLFNLQGRKFNYKPLCIAIAIALSYSPYRLQTRYYYREIDKKYLTTAFESTPLSGIYSSKKRVEAIDSLLYRINSIPDKERKNFVLFNAVPFLYALINRPCLMSNTWDSIIPMETFKKELEMFALRRSVDFAVVAKVDTRMKNWPEKDTLLATKLQGKYSPLDKKIHDYYLVSREFVVKNKFRMIYENNAFSLYQSTW